MSESTISILTLEQVRQLRRFFLWVAGIVGIVAIVATVSAAIWRTPTLIALMILDGYWWLASYRHGHRRAAVRCASR